MEKYYFKLNQEKSQNFETLCLLRLRIQADIILTCKLKEFLSSKSLNLYPSFLLMH